MDEIGADFFLYHFPCKFFIRDPPTAHSKTKINFWKQTLLVVVANQILKSENVSVWMNPQIQKENVIVVKKVIRRIIYLMCMS